MFPVTEESRDLGPCPGAAETVTEETGSQFGFFAYGTGIPSTPICTLVSPPRRVPVKYPKRPCWLRKLFCAGMMIMRLGPLRGKQQNQMLCGKARGYSVPGFRSRLISWSRPERQQTKEKLKARGHRSVVLCAQDTLYLYTAVTV